MKNFIEATPSSYFLSGSYFTVNYQSFILNKFNRTTLDTTKTFIYNTNAFCAVINFIKLHDNKYFLIGNTGNSTATWPIMFHIDSNLAIVSTKNIATNNNFGISDAIYNPANKKILLAGGTGSGQYLNTFIYIDTLGSISQTAFGSSKYLDRSILQVYYRPLDTAYIAVGLLKTGVYGNIELTKLCISKYDINLNLKWEKTYGDAMAGNALVDGVLLNDGSIVVSGTYSQLTSLPLGNSNRNGVVLKTDKNGKLLWAREYDHVAPGNLVEMFYGVDKTLDKGFILCGSVIGPPSTKSKAWAVKTDSMGCVTPGCVSSVMQVDSIIYPPPQPVDTTTASTVGIRETEVIKPHLKIYPNPASQIVKVVFTSLAAGEKKEYIFVVTNALGQIVLNAKSNNASAELDISDLKNGIYFLHLFDKEAQIATAKFVKE